MKKLVISLLIATPILGAHQSVLGMQIGPSQEATTSTNSSDSEPEIPEITVDPNLVIASLTRTAQSGNTNAMIQLGILYRDGIPGRMKQNPDMAISCFTQAAQGGNSNAMIDLGILYRDGIPGIMAPNPNPNRAIYWFTQAAKEGNPDAKTHLEDIESE